jgi:hypothetical protein
MDESKEKNNMYGSDSEDDFTLIESAEVEEVVGSISDISISSGSDDEALEEVPEVPIPSTADDKANGSQHITDEVVTNTVLDIVSDAINTGIEEHSTGISAEVDAMHVDTTALMELLRAQRGNHESFKENFDSFCDGLRHNSEAINRFTELAESFMKLVSDIGTEVGFDSKLEVCYEDTGAANGRSSENTNECEQSSESEKYDSSCDDEETPLHVGFVCDGCEQTPIRGIRYHSTTAWDFDLCERCASGGAWDETHGPFVQIVRPRPASRSSLADVMAVAAERARHGKCEEPRGPVHSTVQCDGCDIFPIRGTRFKSSTRDDFDLCEVCEKTGEWQMEYGPFLKITNPSESPALLVVGLDDEDYSRRFNRSNRNGTIDECCMHQEDLEKCKKCRCIRKLSRRFSRSLRNSSKDKRKDDCYSSETIEPPGVQCVPIMKPNTVFNKTWTIKNDGLRRWPKKVQLRWVGEHEIQYVGHESTQPFRFSKENSPSKLRPGESIDVVVPFTAPSVDGEYESYFQLCNKHGEPFGSQLCLKLIVSSNEGEAQRNPSNREGAEPTPQNIEDIANAFNDLLQFSAEGLSAIATALVVPPPETENTTESNHGDSIAQNEGSEVTNEAESRDVDERRSVEEVAQQLREMGFTDEDKNKTLIYKHGTLEAVVEELLREA